VRGARRPTAASASLPVALLAWTVLTTTPAGARTGGISGASGKQGSTCNECHTGGTRPDVGLEIPAVIHVGEIVPMRFTVHAGSPAGKAAGLDVAVEAGTLMAIAGQGTHLSNGELTHNEPQDNDDTRTAGWDFRWKAPAAAGRYRFWAAGNSVNLNGQPSGDRSDAIVVRVDVVAAEESTPTATPTATSPPPTATQTATATPSATTPPTATQTSSPTFSPTTVPTASTTSTPTLTASPSATEIPPSATATPSESATPAPTTPDAPTETPSSSPEPTGTAIPSPTVTFSPFPCPGDCNRDGQVAVNEIITAVNIALGNQTLDTCPNADITGDQRVTINELITFVNGLLESCGD